MNVFETPGIGQSLETSAESIRQSLTLLKPEKPPKPPEYPKTYPDDSFEKFKKIIEKAGTILWGGPMGMYEDERFEKGTKEIAQAIIDNKSSFNVAGGGETISFIRKFKLEKGFNFLSTGGSAMLNLLNKKDLLGIIALNNHYGN